MTNIKLFEENLDFNNRIPVASISKKCKRFLIVSLLSLSIIHFSLLQFFGLSILSVSLTLFSLLICAISLRKTYLSLAAAALKGDTLILKSINDTNCVTSIRSIRKINTHKIGNTTITSIHYKLDGSTKKAVLVSDTDKDLQPSEAIRSAQRYFKNKRQIYKPGPVS